MFNNISLRETLLMMVKVAICYYIYTIAPESRFVDAADINGNETAARVLPLARAPPSRPFQGQQLLEH
jgi:hypothetical protein